jgi:transposase-like protein
LAPSEKYEVFVQVLTQQATQREAAEKWGVDRSTVIGICRTAKQGAVDALAAAVPGRSGKSAEQVELEAARAEIERLRATVTEQAGDAAPAAGKISLGLTAGPVPARVDAHVKAGLLTLAAHAQAEGGWSLRRAAAVLGVEHTRLGRWAVRATTGDLEDAKPGPEVAVHALLDWERAAIVKLAEEWGEIDRSHRKLAHRGSRLDMVHASESTVLRVLIAEGVHLPGRPAREPRAKRPFPPVGRAGTRGDLDL